MSYTIKCMQGNSCEAISINEKNDNTITEGYISSQQLQEELKNAGKITTSYIEKLKTSLSEKDAIALKEQIESEEFRMQLRKASEDSKEKINQIFERSRLSKSLREQAINIQNMKEKFNKEYDKFFKEAQEKTITNLKRELDIAKQTNNK